MRFLSKKSSPDLELLESNLLSGSSSNYRWQHHLGQGCYGQVIQCLKLDTKETVAVKVLKVRRKNVLVVKKELAMLTVIRSLDQEKCNIVRFYEGFVYGKFACLVFEKLDMSLHSYIGRRIFTPMSLDEIRVVTQQLVSALEALESIGLIHTDLKSDNIMLVDQKNQPFRVKIIDFGLAVPASEVKCGTKLQPVGYRAPEVILGLPISEAIDMWSLGCIMAKMFLGGPLYPWWDEYAMVRAIVSTQGMPADHLLEAGLRTKRHFTKNSKQQTWRLKRPWEYFLKTGQMPSSNRIYEFGSLDVSLRRRPVADEDEKDFLAFADLLKRMLELDAEQRITPSEALRHRFLSPSHLQESDNNSSYVKDSLSDADRGEQDEKERDIEEDDEEEGDILRENDEEEGAIKGEDYEEELDILRENDEEEGDISGEGDEEEGYIIRENDEEEGAIKGEDYEEELDILRENDEEEGDISGEGDEEEGYVVRENDKEEGAIKEEDYEEEFDILRENDEDEGDISGEGDEEEGYIIRENDEEEGAIKGEDYEEEVDIREKDEEEGYIGEGDKEGMIIKSEYDEEKGENDGKDGKRSKAAGWRDKIGGGQEGRLRRERKRKGGGNLRRLCREAWMRVRNAVVSLRCLHMSSPA